MSQSAVISQSARLRLARYHCLLEELMHSGAASSITSREMARQLGVTEESVRSDLSPVEIKGRPGAGYDVAALHLALAEFLGLSDVSPFVVVGSLPMLQALPIVFPADEFGMRPIAYFSEREEDIGSCVEGLEVRPLAEIAGLRSESPSVVALVACAPDYIDVTLAALSAAGIDGVLMLTPRIRPIHPEGMQVTYFRIPCALKSLVASSHSAEGPASALHSCCGEAEGPTA
jgi:redox-sensing transcriptional repressor